MEKDREVGICLMHMAWRNKKTGKTGDKHHNSFCSYNINNKKNMAYQKDI